MISLFPYFTTLITLICLPFFCWSDIKTRTVNIKWWILLIIPGGINLTAYLLESPERNFYLLGVSIALCLILLVLSFVGGIGGADFIFASIIILFIPYNPFVFPRVFFPLDFFWTLLLVTITLPIIIYAYNFKAGNIYGDEVTARPPYTFMEMFTKYPRGIPFMLPISFAFVTTLIMEVLL